MDFADISIISMLVLGLVGLLVGYFLLMTIVMVLPRKLAAENDSRLHEIINQANRQKERIIAEGRKRSESKAKLSLEELDTEIEESNLAFKSMEEELDILSETVTQSEQRLLKQEQDLVQRQSKLQELSAKLETLQALKGQSDAETVAALRAVNADINCDSTIDTLKANAIAQRQLTAQRTLKYLQEELNTHTSKLAKRMLDRISSRYAPDLVWPKSSYVIDIQDKGILEALNSPASPLIANLTELTDEVSISFTTDKDDLPLGIKLVGGYGIDKEAARQTLETLINKPQSEWRFVSRYYAEARDKLNTYALQLGRAAVAQLGLVGMHDEILRMVGALNWRTSYRQNQYLHSLEVATIAGIVASELGLDAMIAKRCGLLHDIGKGIDYKIEGSHAVISGDYADRYGEKRLICDTVMSHHNDLVLETPMSFVLKTADTLSGARPGARVNIEEGYQIRLSSIENAVRSFKGIVKVAIMSGGREVHVEVANNRVQEQELAELANEIARKIEVDVAFPGQIKVLVTRRFEASAVA